jgi:hypothetical protein
MHPYPLYFEVLFAREGVVYVIPPLTPSPPSPPVRMNEQTTKENINFLIGFTFNQIKQPQTS